MNLQRKHDQSIFPRPYRERRVVSPRFLTAMRDGVFCLNYDLLRKTPTSAVAEEAPGNHVQRRLSVRKVLVRNQHTDGSPLLLRFGKNALAIPNGVNGNDVPKMPL